MNPFILSCMKRFIHFLFLSLVVLFTACSNFNTSKQIEHYTLQNGLNVFTVENHSVPLVYIEIAVRAGAVTQTSENAGLFHLYEHMMFKGNELYPDASSVQKALTDMGVASWNGTTGTDCVNYFFTIPSTQIENGLAFWNAAIRTPLMKESELENEKKVVLSEIKGDESEPWRIAMNHIHLTLFPDAPYKTDPAGSVPVVENATVSQLKEIQSKFYIPANAALFIGGDIDRKEVKTLVNNIYGSWENPEGNFSEEESAGVEQLNAYPLDKAEYRVVKMDSVSPGIAQVLIEFRGPDADYNLKDTYTADMLSFSIQEPGNAFNKVFTEDDFLEIPDEAYINFSYGTNRKTGIINFSSVLLNPSDNIAERVKYLENTFKNKALHALTDEMSLTKQKKDSILHTIHNDSLFNAQTASGLLSTLRFWWTCTSPDYYFNYEKNISKVNQKEIKDFTEKYFASQNPLVVVLVNPQVYEENKSSFEENGFTLVTKENSFWWKNKKFSVKDSDNAFSESLNEVDAASKAIYKPEANAEHSKKDNLLSKKVLKLSNGIPVYIQKMPSSVDTVNIGIKGGVLRLTEKTSGLEDALLGVMANSSRSYSYDERKNILYSTGSSIDSFSKLSGSALTLNCLDSDLYKMLPVFVDGFINPEYEEKVMSLLNTSMAQSVQSLQNEPESLLSYYGHKEVYKNHPYAASYNVTPESIENITKENMILLHKELLDPSVLFVVATGNINENKLIKELNKTLGKLEQVELSIHEKNENVLNVKVPEVSISDENKVYVHPSAGSSGHIMRVFRSPSNESEDFIPCVIASKLYSTLMFNVVREHYGVCYTPSSYVVGSHAPTGSEYLYRVSDFKNFKSAVEEARTLMLEDKLIKSVSLTGEYVFTDIESELEGAKNSYINSTYASSAKSSGVAATLTYNILQFDDMNYDSVLLSKVRAVTSGDVLRVFKKYWTEEPSVWFAVVGEENFNLDF